MTLMPMATSRSVVFAAQVPGGWVDGERKNPPSARTCGRDSGPQELSGAQETSDCDWDFSEAAAVLGAHKFALL